MYYFIVSLGDWAVDLSLVSGCCVCKCLLGMLLSCFGHARANNNSKLSCGLEPCSSFCLGLSPCGIHLLFRAVSCLFYCGMQWLVFGLLRVGLEVGYA